MNLIQVEGSRTSYDIDDPAVKESIVRIANKFFWRDSDKIVKVEGRYYRKESPLIVKDYNGKFIVRQTAVELAPGVFASPADANVVQLSDGTWTSSNNVTKIGNKYYLLSDTSIVKNHVGHGEYILKEDAIALWEDAYGKAAYVPKIHKKTLVFCSDGPTGGFILPKHVVKYVNENGEIVQTANSVLQKLIAKQSFKQIFWKFKNPNFPSPEHIKTIWAHPNNVVVSLNNAPFNYQVLKKHAAKVQKDVDFYRSLSIRDDCDSIRKRLNTFYDEAGPDENTAKNFTLEYDTFKGGGVIHAGGGKLEISDHCRLTGGKKYTFGVEIETSAGLLTADDCRSLGIDLVADSSIGSGEYTTKPLHGDKGITSLKAIMEVIHKKCLVDNRDAVHIHIGGAKDKRVDTPSFNIEFGINAIQLGCQLEDELFAAQPPYRQPNIKYCSGIKMFEAINRDNVKNYLGAYVFGPEMEQLTEAEIIDGTYQLSNRYNSEVEQNRWATGRYKWLNMVNAFSKGRFSTIEFRLFGATTCFEKVYNYVLTAQAFVWFVENRQGMIAKGGVTLKQVFKEAYSDYPDLINQLNKFYDERKMRFAEARAKVKQ